MPVPPGLPPREMFIRATFQLAKQHPTAWEEFLIAFNAYTVDELEHATGTTTESLAISVGMSRRMVGLRNDFRDIEALMSKVSVNRSR